MRLFLAVDLDEPRRLAIARLAAGLRKRLGGAHVERATKWVEPRNLHLTIRFVGEADDERAARIQDAVRRPLLTPVFALEFGSAGVFPAGGAPRVLWLGVVQGAAALADLHDEIEGRLQAIGESPEPRAFAAHLTLARFRDLDRPGAAAVRAGIQGVHLAAGACPVDAVTLYRSHLAPGGPSYTALLRSSLAR